jgi:hypothetical protein
MAFEYDRFEMFTTRERQLIYFFNYSIIVFSIIACHTNSGVCGSAVWPILLMAFCVKAVPIHVIGAI